MDVKLLDIKFRDVKNSWTKLSGMQDHVNLASIDVSFLINLL
jgi:hypothetical protein